MIIISNDKGKMRDFIIIQLNNLAESLINDRATQIQQKTKQLQEIYPQLEFVHVLARLLVEFQTKHYPWLTLNQKNRNGMWVARQVVPDRDI